MFGYINVNAKELSKENKEEYQAYYCGLCRKLKKDCGIRGQMLLNYDMTFLIVLLTGLYEPEEESGDFICMLHPSAKKLEIRNEITAYAAAMNIILAYHKLLDDWADDRNYTKKALASILKKNYDKAVTKYPRQAQAVEKYLGMLAECERNKVTNLDEVSGLSGQLLAEILDYRQDVWSGELRTMGFYLGKFIYLIDAYEDLDKDEKTNSYNPLRQLKQDEGQDYETICRLMLTSMMAECAKSFERMPILLHADILRNILYSGVWTKYEYLQLKKKKRKRNDGSLSGAEN